MSTRFSSIARALLCAAAMAAAKPIAMSAERDTPLGCGTSRSTRSTQSRVRARSSTLAGIGCGARGCATAIVPALSGTVGHAPVV